MQEEQEPIKRLQHIDALSSVLASRRGEFVTGRQKTGVERRWVEDLDSYFGRDGSSSPADVVQAAQQRDAGGTTRKTAIRSQVLINIIGPKTDAGCARVQELLFGSDERNFAVEPTPVAKLATLQRDTRPVTIGGQPAVTPEGQQLKVSDIVEMDRKEAIERASMMEDEIADQLDECSYNESGRRVIFYAAVFGTGIMCGPTVISRTSRAWLPVPASDGKIRWTYHSVTDLRPMSRAVDPRNFFPDPACGNNIQNGSGCFERQYITKRQIRELLREPGYIKENIYKVLSQKPMVTPLATVNLDPKSASELVTSGELYEMWIYYGEFEVRDLRAAGLGDPDETGMSPIPPEANDDDAIQGCAVLINDVVIKMAINPLDSGEYPYDVYNWRRDEDSIWGYGIPHAMRVQQAVSTAAWRMAMDSATMVAGPQVIVKRSCITPMDGSWQLSPRKFWSAAEELDDVRKAFTIVEFGNRVPDMIQLIDVASKLADQETALPVMMQGERGSAPDTVGGMTILMNNANTMIKRLVKQFDDQITVPHIRRYFEWNMLYSRREEIKGDFFISPRGSSALVVRDQKNQSAMQFAATFANHPRFGDWIDEEKLIRQVAEAIHLPGIIRNQADVTAERANRQPQDDPKLAVARLQAQTAKEIAELNAQVRIEEISRKIAADLEKAGLLRENDAEKIKAMIAQTVIESRAKENLFNAELAVKAQYGSGI